MSVQRCGVADSVVGESRRELNDRSQRSEPGPGSVRHTDCQLVCAVREAGTHIRR